MCTPAAPQGAKTYEPSAAVNGVWTPTQAYTKDEEAAIMGEAQRPTLITVGSDETGVNATSYMGPAIGAELGAKQKIADRAGVAAADAQKLAAAGKQAPKQAPSTPDGPKEGAAGGPTTLLTGGTASSALTTRKTPSSTLLGG